MFISLQMRFAFLLSFLYLFVSPEPCQIPNDCSSSSIGPYCIQGNCVECDPDSLVPECECPPGDYCITDPEDPNIGMCQLKDKEILDRPCQMILQNQAPTLVTEGDNDLLFCGLLKFDNSSNVRWVEWEGVCIRNVCKQCSQAPFAQVPYSMCSDGRICTTQNIMEVADGGIISYAYLPFQNMVMTAYISIIFTQIVGLTGAMVVGIGFPCWVWFRQTKDKSRVEPSETESLIN